MKRGPGIFLVIQYYFEMGCNCARKINGLFRDSVGYDSICNYSYSVKRYYTPWPEILRFWGSRIQTAQIVNVVHCSWELVFPWFSWGIDFDFLNYVLSDGVALFYYYYFFNIFLFFLYVLLFYFLCTVYFTNVFVISEIHQNTKYISRLMKANKNNICGILTDFHIFTFSLQIIYKKKDIKNSTYDIAD